jgi:hypothetical protein
MPVEAFAHATDDRIGLDDSIPPIYQAVVIGLHYKRPTSVFEEKVGLAVR